ncbi:hypothetical protein LCGC14_0370130 [marine sediment metagenome]|uniref:Uncharacterized protein n=1 Tax=marine sediment metagenome TaxID=412755 RepID=A0A0F9TBE9_9ZZZZ
MSAYIVNKGHINAMLNSRIQSRYGARWYHGEWHELTPINADAVGQMLLDENIKSVMSRYEDRTITDLPGSAEYLIPFKHRFTEVPSAIEAIKLTHCYEYQSCEHEEWEASEAKAFCSALIEDKIGELPGYDDAPWNWPVIEMARV